MRGFDFLVGVGVLVVVLVGSLVVPAVLMLLLPSRKGKMRTERRITMPGDVTAAWDLLAGRFEYEGFEVDRSDRPHAFNARRAARTYREGDEDIVTHATKPLEVDVSLRRAGGAAATDVTIALWMNDFVLFDSGEGRQIDLMLGRLTTAELDRDPPPVTPSPSMAAIIAVFGAGLTLLLMLVPKYWPWLRGPSPMLGWGLGIAGGGWYAISMARMALRAIKSKPAEVTGKAMAVAATIFGAAAIAAGAAWAVVGVMGMVRGSA